MINGYMSVKEAAKKWNISSRRVQIYCSEERIHGSAKLGREWAIPIKMKEPQDGRITTGEYRG